MNYDRFAPESHEDFLCRGKSSRECAEIRARLAARERERDEEERESQAEREEAYGHGASADLSGCSGVSTPCVITQYHIGKEGYGHFRKKKKAMHASRAAWIAKHGPIPNGLWVLHKCNNRACVNVDHLYLGTKTDNVRDALRAGTHCGKQKLTVQQAIEIRESTKSADELALIYPMVTRKHIVKIKRGAAWKWVSQEAAA